MHDTRTIVRPILRYTYDSDGFIRVTRTSLSYVYHHNERQSKSVGIRKELGVNSIQEKVREMRLCWYGHMRKMEEKERHF